MMPKTGVLRSKGFFWVAADHRIAYEWAQAGGVSNITPSGMWWAAVPQEQWGHADGERPDQRDTWDQRYGDRAQQLVFIGQDLNEPEVRAKLDACLLDADLADADSRQWAALSNPFPKFSMVSESE